MSKVTSKDFVDGVYIKVKTFRDNFTVLQLHNRTKTLTPETYDLKPLLQRYVLNGIPSNVSLENEKTIFCQVTNRGLTTFKMVGWLELDTHIPFKDIEIIDVEEFKNIQSL